MRAASRSPVLALVGALVVSSVAGTGCASQAPWTGPNPFAAAQPIVPPADVRPLRDVVAMGPPRPLDDASPASTPNQEWSRMVAGPTEAAHWSLPGGESAPVVWRASAPGLGGDTVEGEPAPLLPASWDAVSRRHGGIPVPVESELPRELDKVTLPPYRIEPPDVLVINASRLVPRPPYRIKPLDELLIQAPPAQVIPNEPIGGSYVVGPDGRVDLGYSYGRVALAGLKLEEARAAVAKHVAELHGIKAPAVVVALRQARGLEPVRGEHLVRMDGTVSLGGYGDVYLAGLTLPEAKQVIEAQLARTLLDPEVTVDVAAYNSKLYYVIFDGGGYGQMVFKRPVVGGETVLDALGGLRGLPAHSSTERIWLARPVPGHAGYRVVLPVDWAAITEDASTKTNYQVLPGDRIYVKADHWVAAENKVAKALAPLHRLFGFTLLGDPATRATACPDRAGN